MILLCGAAATLLQDKHRSESLNLVVLPIVEKSDPIFISKQIAISRN